MFRGVKVRVVQGLGFGGLAFRVFTLFRTFADEGFRVKALLNGVGFGG